MSRIPRTLGFAALIGTCVIAPPGFAQLEDARIRFEAAPGIVASHGAQWVPAEGALRNASELVRLGDHAGGAPLARTTILIEKRSDHESALQRLVEIAEEVDQRVEVREIGGWPAIERSYLAPFDRQGRGDDGEELLGMRVTTAIAADHLVVRVESRAEVDTPNSVIDEILEIGRTVEPPARGFAADTQTEIERLRAVVERLDASARDEATKISREFEPMQIADPSGIGAPVLTQQGLGELEMAVSTDGQNVVMAANSGYAFSSDGAVSFTAVGAPNIPFPMNGDPSVAVGASSNFYLATIAFPDGSPGAGGLNGCSTAMTSSGDGGQTFNFVNNAVFCSRSTCFPDQEHIAADRRNPAPGGGDQVYSVWRNFTFSGDSCRSFGTGSSQARIVCSNDSGANWTDPAVIGSGDFPRVTVGPNGFVYVVTRDGGNLMAHKFSSCASGLVPQDDFPKRVATVDDVSCPVPGLDRCNNGNMLSSHTVAVDDVDPNLVYVAYADETSSGNEDVIVRASLDGGLTWPRSGVANALTTARRFMPWVCAQNGVAYVSWYDRRASNPSNNDLTDYFLGAVRLGNVSNQLVSDFEVNLSNNADPQCASGWPLAPRSTADSDSCSTQPQQAGVCSSSTQRCDFDAENCPLDGDVCQSGRGVPKYGDYNGNACAAGQVYTAWASATAPAGLPTAQGISIYTSVMATASLNVRITVLPSSDPGRFVGRLDSAVVVSGGPLVASGFRNVGAGEHVVSVGSSGSTELSDYAITIGGDCTPSGAIGLAIGDKKTCTITAIAESGEAGCKEDCEDERDECMQDPETTPEFCVFQLRACKGQCEQLDQQTLNVRLLVQPSSDTGRFNLQIDGNTIVSNVGDDGSTGPQQLPIGTHRVGVTAASGTDLSDYQIRFGGDCRSDGTVVLAGSQRKTCIVTSISSSPPPTDPPEDRAQCLGKCNRDRDICMRDPQTPPEICVDLHRRCEVRCPPA